MTILPIAFSFIEASNTVTDAESLNELFTQAAHKLGFPMTFVGAATHPEYYGADSPILQDSMSPEWIEHYMGSNYAAADPVVRHTASSTLPFRWSDLPATSKLEKTIMNEAKEAGMVDGIAVPIHGVNQDLFFVSLVTDQTEVMQSVSTDHLRLMTVQLQSTYLRLAKSTGKPLSLPTLTPRERDCLTYCAVGKTSWEVAQILGVSEKTVDFHLANASSKLQANSRVFAVVKALRLGLIMP